MQNRACSLIVALILVSVSVTPLAAQQKGPRGDAGTKPADDSPPCCTGPGQLTGSLRPLGVQITHHCPLFALYATESGSDLWWFYCDGMSHMNGSCSFVEATMYPMDIYTTPHPWEICPTDCVTVYASQSLNQSDDTNPGGNTTVPKFPGYQSKGRWTTETKGEFLFQNGAAVKIFGKPDRPAHTGGKLYVKADLGDGEPAYFRIFEAQFQPGFAPRGTNQKTYRLFALELAGGDAPPAENLVEIPQKQVTAVKAGGVVQDKLFSATTTFPAAEGQQTVESLILIRKK